MKKQKEIQLDFEIDKLTNSIENAISGEVFDTSVIKISDPKLIKKPSGFLIGMLKSKIKVRRFMD